MYELFEHTSDLGLRVKAADIEALFREAAEGLFSMIVEEEPTGGTTKQYEFRLHAEGYDTLLFDWLSELLYTFHTERTLLSNFEIRLEGRRLEARATGRPLDHAAHQLLHEVKAITYHGLRVERADGGWLAELIVDI